MDQILYLEIKQLLVAVMVDRVITQEQDNRVLVVVLVVVVDKATTVVVEQVVQELQDKVLQVEQLQVLPIIQEEEVALVALETQGQ
jgi:hypothetical protein